MGRVWTTTLPVFTGVTLVATMVGCCVDGTPKHQLVPVKPPLPHHHVYVPNDPLPYQASPFCFGYYPTCWRAWPSECVSCPPASTCGDVVIEDRPIEEVEVIPTPTTRQAPPAVLPVESAPTEGSQSRSEAVPDSTTDEPSAEPRNDAETSPAEAPSSRRSGPSGAKPEPALPPEPEPDVSPLEESSQSLAPGSVLASDDSIAERVVKRLESQKQRGLIKDFDIEVSVAAGVVTLSGDVTSARHREVALQATRQTPGVKRIINSLTVTR